MITHRGGHPAVSRWSGSRRPKGHRPLPNATTTRHRDGGDEASARHGDGLETGTASKQVRPAATAKSSSWRPIRRGGLPPRSRERPHRPPHDEHAASIIVVDANKRAMAGCTRSTPRSAVMPVHSLGNHNATDRLGNIGPTAKQARARPEAADAEPRRRAASRAEAHIQGRKTGFLARQWATTRARMGGFVHPVCRSRTCLKRAPPPPHAITANAASVSPSGDAGTVPHASSSIPARPFRPHPALTGDGAHRPEVTEKLRRPRGGGEATIRRDLSTSRRSTP